ncbi:MAG: STAS/SEC14 domain-containing protein [Myxococcota bacterium]
MPIEHEFDARRRLLCVRMLGVVTDDDVLDYAEAITADESRGPEYDELIDLRKLETPAASTDTLRRVADIFRKYERQPELVKVAFIAASDAAYGIARMYQAFRAESSADMRVFREADEARRWLGLEPE